MPRGDLALALVLASLTVLTRVPFRARLLPTWDAVQFALALREYDVVRHQPHPPGYILYVAAGRAADLVVGDSAASFVWLSVVASAATVFLVYRLAWTLYGRATALVSAAGLLTSPLFWYHGVVGLSYAAESALATGVALLVWRIRVGGPAAAAWAALALGLAGGVRQSILALLMPLWFATTWTVVPGWRPRLGALAILGTITAGWLVPMVWLAGGPSAYVGAARELYQSTVRATTLLGPHWPANLQGLADATVLGMGLFLPWVAWVVTATLRRGAPWGPRAWFIAGWLVPALAVYGGLHFGQYGYLVTILPGLYILGARGVVTLAECLAASVPGLARVAAPAGLAGIILAHAAAFTSAPPLEVPSPSDAPSDLARWQASLGARYRFGLWATTAPGLRDREAVVATYVKSVRQAFDPADTVLVTELGNPRSYPWFRHVMYYLPEFPVYSLRVGAFSPGAVASRSGEALMGLEGLDLLLPATARRLVWVVDHWNPDTPRPEALEERVLPHGRRLYVLDLWRSGQRPVTHAGYRLTPVTAIAWLP